MSLFDLSGKVAVITGSSRGIGRAIAERMAEHGAKVVVSSRKAEACEVVAKAIRDKGGEALVQPCNITKKAELQNLVDVTLKKWGRIDILVCNASVNRYYGPSINTPDDAFDHVIAANVQGTFWLCNMVLPQMAELGGGSVIIISSVGGLIGNDNLGVYALSKAAEMQLARNIAAEWGPKHIRANSIAPGLIKTDMSEAIWSKPENYARAVALTPLQRIGEPDEIAGAAVFLASAAANFLTGQNICIDGGRLIGGRVAG
jgi:NAD(P)-dependent dehydrogenase (short-subunit alcohol dehydrogenase family)